MSARGSELADVSILAREPVLGFGSFPAEVVTCQLGEAGQRRIFCKYEAEWEDFDGHRGGPAYEALVYRSVLRGAGQDTPTFYGSYENGDGSGTWLFMEYLDGAERLPWSGLAHAMSMAAAWIGAFHAQQERAIAEGCNPSLKVYDREYYVGWLRRTAVFARELRSEFPWLRQLCHRVEGLLPLLLESPATVVHGEYYPKNILIWRGCVYPVDWESAAIAPGELDLASLTERWKAGAVRECERAYRRARWPGGVPPDGFERRLDAARLYFQFRWLGERPDRTTDPGIRWRFGELQSVGERLGLI